MDNKTSKTPDYTKRAIAKYQQNKDRVNLLLDAGTKERIKQKYGDISINNYIKQLINNDLNNNNNNSNILPF